MGFGLLVGQMKEFHHLTLDFSQFYGLKDSSNNIKQLSIIDEIRCQCCGEIKVPLSLYKLVEVEIKQLIVADV